MLPERVKSTIRVEEALRTARTGRSTLICVTGPLGIGRSALLRQLSTGAPADVRVLTAHAAPMEQDFPFGVAHQLLDCPTAATAHTSHRSPRERPEDSVRRVFDDDGAGPGPDVCESTFHGLRSMLARMSEATPLLLLVDDLQWADGPSLRWLSYLAKRLHGLRIVLVYSVRDGDRCAQRPLVREMTDSARQHLRLAPLTPEATHAVIEEHFTERADEAYAQACHDVSGGNPLLLLCVLRDLSDAGQRPDAEAARTVRSLRPAELRERIAECLRHQSEPVREVAAAIAVLGEQAEPALVARLSALDDIGLASALRELARLGLLRDERSLRFVHRTVRDAVESSLNMGRREDLHHDAAALLNEEGGTAEQIAAQLMAVAGPGPRWSTGVLRSAAGTALRRGAPRTAAGYLRRALLDNTGQNEGRARLLVDLATAERTFDPGASERHIAQALPMLPQVDDRAAAVQRMPPALFTRPSAAMVEMIDRISEELGEPSVLAGAARETALRLEARRRHYAQEDPEALASAVERLRDMGGEPPMESGAERELAAVLLCSATFAGGLSASAVARTATMVLEREPVDQARTHSTVPLAAVTLLAADSARSIGPWLMPDEHPARRASTASAALLLATRAMVRVACGRLAWAREHAVQAVRLTAPHWDEAPSLVLAAVALELDDTALSEQILAGANSGRPRGIALTCMLRILQASVHARRGMRATALEDLLACGRQLESRGWHNSAVFPWRPRAIGLYERMGDSLSAMVLADEEHSWAAAWGAPAVLGRALYLKGRLYGNRGIPMLRKAVEVLRSSDNELELARSLLLLARRLHRGTAAEAALREGSELAAACGAPWLVERMENGAGTAPQQKKMVLTPSERKVVSLAGGGLTNQEIANELGVSSRAVEKHLTNSYRKIGVSGRAELGEALRAPEFAHLLPL